MSVRHIQLRLPCKQCTCLSGSLHLKYTIPLHTTFTSVACGVHSGTSRRTAEHREADLDVGHVVVYFVARVYVIAPSRLASRFNDVAAGGVRRFRPSVAKVALHRTQCQNMWRPTAACTGHAGTNARCKWPGTNLKAGGWSCGGGTPSSCKPAPPASSASSSVSSASSSSSSWASRAGALPSACRQVNAPSHNAHATDQTATLDNVRVHALARLE